MKKMYQESPASKFSLKRLKPAFTLAEVLLTLAIIGVVAALTVPAVITKVTNDQHVTSLKKAYNTLRTAENKAITENGEIGSWGVSSLSDEEFFNKFYRPHLDILKDCGMATDTGCFPPQSYYLSGAEAYSDDEGDGYKIITSDGIAFQFWKTSVQVDVNGNKRPNQFGRDIFNFHILYRDYMGISGIKPAGSYDSYGNPLTDVETNCCLESYGHECASFVLSRGDMKYPASGCSGSQKGDSRNCTLSYGCN